MSSHFPPLPSKQYDIIYADPPWDYKGGTQHSGARVAGGSSNTSTAGAHYLTLSLNDLKALPVADIAEPDCLLFMWATSPHLDQAIELGKTWGFQWATVAFVWDKQKHNPGSYTLSQCELCLVFKRGKIPQPRGIRNAPQLVSVPRGEHSAKPAQVRDLITAMFPTQHKIELFARREQTLLGFSPPNPNGDWEYWGKGVECEI